MLRQMVVALCRSEQRAACRAATKRAQMSLVSRRSSSSGHWSSGASPYNTARSVATGLAPSTRPIPGCDVMSQALQWSAAHNRMMPHTLTAKC